VDRHAAVKGDVEGAEAWRDAPKRAHPGVKTGLGIMIALYPCGGKKIVSKNMKGPFFDRDPLKFASCVTLEAYSVPTVPGRYHHLKDLQLT
jgi:hypothetical protein